MPTRLRKSLYIGLGGTGMDTILRTKKMFIENYGGQVPPMIGFLGIDTDKGVYDKKLLTSSGESVKLEQFEQCSISAENPLDSYERLEEGGQINWMFPENIRAINRLDKGAGQVRTNGRLAFELNITNLRAVIQGSIDKVRNIQNIQSKLYEVLDADLEIHIVFSVAGGTGAGTFIDVAYLIRSICDNSLGRNKFNLAGYAVLANVFRAMEPTGPAMARVFTNAYGSLRDLDFLMNLEKNNSDPVKITTLHDNSEFKYGPFDTVYAINNANKNGQVFSNIESLSEVMSLVLISASGEVTGNVGSVMDNVNIQGSGGVFDVDDKVGWVSSVGASEIVYNSENIANIYAKKAASRIIGILTNSNGEANIKANEWIDRVKIRENKGEDNLIDYIYDMKKLISMMEITQNDNPLPEVETYINQASNRDFTAKITEKLETTKTSIDDLLNELLNSDKNGISLALETLNEISIQLDEYTEMMKAEQITFEGSSDTLTQQMNNAISDLKDVAHKIIRGNARRAECKGELYIRAKNIAANKLEISRRINAISFYNSLKSHVGNLYDQVEVLATRFKNIATKLNKDVVKLQNLSTESSSIVRIDLSSNIATQVVVLDSELIIADFINTLPKQNLLSISNSDIAENIILNFTNNLPGTIERRAKTVDQALDELNDDTFDHIFNEAKAKASPLLMINDRGYRNINNVPLKQGSNKMYYICVPNSATNRITRTNNDGQMPYFERAIENIYSPKTISTGLKDRVIIYRQEGAYPAFAIASLDTYKIEYDNDNMSPHFDKVIYKRMINENHDFMPKKIDKKAGALEAWVYGCIHGFIKTENGDYMFIDTDDSDLALDNYWVNTKTKFRDEAFDLFCKREALQEQYSKKISEYLISVGQKQYIDLILDAKKPGVYFEKYSRCPVALATIKSRKEYKETLELLKKEINFVNSIELPQ